MSDGSSESDSGLSISLALTSAPSSPRVPITLPKDATSNDLRRLASDATGIPLASLRLIFRGRLVAPSDDVVAASEFKLDDGCVVHCMGKPAAAGPPPTASAPVAAAAAPAPAAAASAGAAVVPPPAPAAPASAAAASTSGGGGGGGSTPLQSALATVRTSTTPATYVTALQTLDRLLGNIIDHPNEEKYRRVKRSNAAFQKRLGGLGGGHDAMLAAGFAVQADDAGVENYVLVPSAEAWPRLVAARAEVTAELGRARTAAAAPAAPAAAPFVPPPGAGAGVGGMPGMGLPGMGGVPPIPGMDPATVQDAVAGMMSDPAALQRMLQNPMVRQMMERDPRFAGNPMMRQSLDALANDPRAIQQVSSMMQDPAMRGMMQQAAAAASQQQQQGGGGAGMGMGMGTGMGMGGAGAGAGAGTAGGMDPALMAQQMQMLQRMSQQMGGAGAGAGGGAAGSTGGAAPNQQQGQQQQGQQQQGSGGGGGGEANDSEMTEEEMIAEAIARSLRES